MRKITVAASCFALGGCVAIGPAFAPAALPPAGEALVYVYREPAWASGGAETYFNVDDRHAFNLANGGYAFVYVAPGLRTLTQGWVLGGDEDRLQLQPVIAAGDVRYFRFSTWQAHPWANTVTWTLAEVPPDVGRREIADNSRQGPVDGRMREIESNKKN